MKLTTWMSLGLSLFFPETMRFYWKPQSPVHWLRSPRFSVKKAVLFQQVYADSALKLRVFVTWSVGGGRMTGTLDRPRPKTCTSTYLHFLCTPTQMFSLKLGKKVRGVRRMIMVLSSFLVFILKYCYKVMQVAHCKSTWFSCNLSHNVAILIFVCKAHLVFLQQVCHLFLVVCREF